jgi:hypothetical protein
MVQVGKFYAELIYADTKTPFKEHTSSDGKFYIEVEPNAEYYIQLMSKSEDPVRVRIKIDGKDVGYDVNLSKNQASAPSYFCGLRSVDKNGGTIHQALKFAKAPVVQKTEDKKVPPEFWTGSVEVEFYEAVYEGLVAAGPSRPSQNAWSGGDVGYMIGKSNPDKKKGVMSAAGDAVDYRPAKRARHSARYKKGGHLKTISLNYCSTVGLIFAGILTKPPLWEWGQMIKPGVQVS